MSPQAAIYRFSHGHLDPGQRTLTVAGALIDVQPMVFDLLAYFLAHPGRAISKEELLENVWSDALGSDAAIARCVLKARRAIGDADQPPAFIKTVNKVGYRLDMAVEIVQQDGGAPRPEDPDEGLQGAVRCPALLPCINRTNDASMDWIEQGLTSLVQHMARGRTQLALVPAQWARRQRERGVDDASLLAATCDMMGASLAVLPEMHRTADGLRLSVLTGRSADDARSCTLEARDIPGLALRLLELVDSQTSLRERSMPQSDREADGDAYWQEQLAKALSLCKQGAFEQAIVLVEECVLRLPPSAQLLTTHAQLLRRTRQLGRAAQQLGAATAIADSCGEDVRVEVLIETAMLAVAESRLGDACRLFDQALELALPFSTTAPLVPEILAAYADVLSEYDPAAGIRVAERGIGAAIAMGNRDMEALARIALGTSLMHVGQLHRAGEIARSAVDLTRRHDLVAHEMNALFVVAALDHEEGCYSLAIDEARQMSRLAVSCGHLANRDRARLQELHSLVHSGRLDAARTLADWLATEGTLFWAQAYNLRCCTALLAWRRGETNATALIRQAGDEAKRLALPREVLTNRLEECFQHIAAGDLTAARAALSDLKGAGADVHYPHARAALALCEGERQNCLALLKTAANAGPPETQEARRANVDLAWMMLEDGSEVDLGALVGHIAASRTEYVPARIVVSLYGLLHNPASSSADEWAAALRSAPRLRARCPWIEDPDFATELRTGSFRKLPELLSRMCW